MTDLKGFFGYHLLSPGLGPPMGCVETWRYNSWLICHSKYSFKMTIWQHSGSFCCFWSIQFILRQVLHRKDITKIGNWHQNRQCSGYIWQNMFSYHLQDTIFFGNLDGIIYNSTCTVQEPSWWECFCKSLEGLKMKVIYWVWVLLVIRYIDDYINNINISW